MEVLSKRIYEILKAKGVSSILHANNVENSCLFLKNRCLMSLESIEKLSSNITIPNSNRNTISYSILNDIFADTVDIHEHANSAHNHGPVLFELDLEIIKNTYTGKIWITKSNPMTWNANTHQERKWFVSANDLEDHFSSASFNHMIAFRHCGGKLPIQGYLKRIILDDPKLHMDRYQIDYFSMAFGALTLAMKQGGVAVPIEKRTCNKECNCLKNYKNSSTEQEKMFTL
jgi:hypothetical protein